MLCVVWPIIWNSEKICWSIRLSINSNDSLASWQNQIKQMIRTTWRLNAYALRWIQWKLRRSVLDLNSWATSGIWCWGYTCKNALALVKSLNYDKCVNAQLMRKVSCTINWSSTDRASINNLVQHIEIYPQLPKQEVEISSHPLSVKP